jgi:hypothetical protein
MRSRQTRYSLKGPCARLCSEANQNTRDLDGVGKRSKSTTAMEGETYISKHMSSMHDVCRRWKYIYDKEEWGCRRCKARSSHEEARRSWPVKDELQQDKAAEEAQHRYQTFISFRIVSVDNNHSSIN